MSVNKRNLSYTLFFLFLFLHGGEFFLGQKGNVHPSRSTHERWYPVSLHIHPTITPPRRIIVCQTSPTPDSARMLERFPTAAWVLGHKMNWLYVNETHLQWIPGLSIQTARRLLRIRDLYPLRDFGELSAFPHIGKKTVRKLQTYCFLPAHAN